MDLGENSVASFFWTTFFRTRLERFGIFTVCQNERKVRFGLAGNKNRGLLVWVELVNFGRVPLRASFQCSYIKIPSQPQ